ncbi:hypothetical protein [Heyndrickxia sporothermodurans]|uniref:hypothetical protein n=1 Tax=Heyndrickxia sporothermodurans TaxID=46224 RepID=UPI002E223601|nr:hypothetical protein [Heyndrickxia sporothermodurans]MED3696367.1 hypothetical protein [Heyndrickxia sporothermodurans]
MNKNELKQLLINSNVPKDLYSLEGGLPNEALCLNEENGQWEVYYSERGVKSQLKRFDSEDRACEYFCKEILDQLN